MAAASRPAVAGDAILGVAPRIAYLPAGTDECVEVMGLAARERMRVAFVGGGTQLGLGRPPEALDAVVRTERMGRILEYAPSDMVLAAEAGATFAHVQATAREHGQMLAIDPPHPERATVGGVVATGAFGPKRARYGAIRDLIIGVTLVRADGTAARGGGKVVKNVAGFDLPKVACGSLGTLGMIATATFRLHPLPEATATALVGGVAAAKVVELLLAARKAQLEPSAAVALRASDGRFDLGVRFEGFAKGVAHQLARLVDLSRALAAPAEALADEGTFWKRHDAARGGGALRARLAALPMQLPAVDALVAPLLRALREGAFAWYATLGFGFVSGDVGDAAAASAALAAGRAGLGAGGSLVVEAAPSELRAVDPWGPVTGSFAIMAALKQRFDPERRLNPGRFVGGL